MHESHIDLPWIKESRSKEQRTHLQGISISPGSHFTVVLMCVWSNGTIFLIEK